MVRTIRKTVNEENLDRYTSYMHQVLDGKSENDPGFRKLALETSHTAKFLSRLDDNIEIIRKSEKPDFIIRKKSRLIGLEHEILINKENKQNEGSLEDLIATVEKEYRKKYPNTKKHLNIYVNSNLRFRKADKKLVVKEVLLIIEHYIINETFIENSYIDDIVMMNHTRLDFVCNLGAWWQKNLDYEVLERSIRKKEKKISDYISNSGIKEQWLLIVIGSLKESSFEIDSLDSLIRPIESKFEKVYLLEDFRANLYEINPIQETND